MRQGRWATCTVGDLSGELTMVVSYLFDPTRDLIRAVQRLIDGEAEERLELLDEPGGHRWWFTRDGDDVCGCGSSGCRT